MEEFGVFFIKKIFFGRGCRFSKRWDELWMKSEWSCLCEIYVNGFGSVFRQFWSAPFGYRHWVDHPWLESWR